MKMYQVFARVLGFAIAAVSVSGCINIPKSSTADAPPADVYTLKAAAGGSAKQGGNGGVIVVARPEVPTGFDTDRIALMFEQGHRLDYYAGASWSGRLNDVLRNFVVQSARRDLPGKVVDTTELNASARYKILVKVTDFQPVYAGGPDGVPRLDVAMTMTLIALPSGKVAANVVAKKSAQASANRMTVITKELETLLQAVTSQALRGIAPHLAVS
jgi:ABC-type uncharacterized transport system auxiliary subunit